MHFKTITAIQAKWILIIFLLFTGVATVLSNIGLERSPDGLDLVEKQMIFYQLREWYAYLVQSYMFVIAAFMYFEKKVGWSLTFVFVLFTLISTLIFALTSFEIAYVLSLFCIIGLLYVLFLPQTREMFGMKHVKDIFLWSLLSVVLFVFFYFGVNALLIFLMYTV
ncbi:hypothetical protein KBD81_06070 [Candidatus Woesebacteria bacterium]|nr:hypothetical protein [Candidatus Woesebacteria bacterium]